MLTNYSTLKQITENRVATDPQTSFPNLKKGLMEIAKVEEISWRHKSRCLWLTEGDRNTRYFQTIANSHRRFNSIENLNIDNEITVQRTDNRKTLNYYQHLYTE